MFLAAAQIPRTCGNAPRICGAVAFLVNSPNGAPLRKTGVGPMRRPSFYGRIRPNGSIGLVRNSP